MNTPNMHIHMHAPHAHIHTHTDTYTMSIDEHTHLPYIPHTLCAHTNIYPCTCMPIHAPHIHTPPIHTHIHPIHTYTHLGAQTHMHKERKEKNPIVLTAVVT